ncbi:MAG: class I SAM-dependent RNA methyltransferase [Gemmatimonadales bacterium]
MSTTVRIRGIAAGGEGVGTLEDGRTVFVPRSAPADLLELANVRLHKRFARAEVGRVVEPGPGRVEPPCEHYIADACGGCQMQHMTVETQQEARAEIVGSALRRLGKLDVENPVVESAPEQWGYRTRITLTVQANGRRIGYHRYDRASEVFDLRRCLIAHPELQRLWTAVRELRSQLPPGLERLGLRIDRGGGLHLLLEPKEPQVWSGAAAFHAELLRKSLSVAIWWTPPEGAPRTLAGSSEPFPATVFEQVNPAMGDRVRAWGLGQLGPVAGQHAWDLYAGVGDTARALAAAGASVQGVESDRRAVALGESRGGDGEIEWVAGRAEDKVGGLKRPDLVVTNPPRTGMDERVVAGIAEAAPSRVLYISCDPATLARDIVRLGDGYRLKALRAFDLFPQTAHVETVALLERA